MGLPNVERAVIDPAKLRDYLLSATHPVGRFKAALFLSLGYEPQAWQRLEADLRAQHGGREVEASAYGRKFAIHARLVGPSGRSGAAR